MLTVQNLNAIQGLLNYLNNALMPPQAEIVPESIKLVDSNGECVGEIVFDGPGSESWAFRS